MNQEIAAAFLIRAWEGVSPGVLDDAWPLYKCPDEYQDSQHSLIENPIKFKS
jgi:hypothetical protein